MLTIVTGGATPTAWLYRLPYLPLECKEQSVKQSLSLGSNFPRLGVGNQLLGRKAAGKVGLHVATAKWWWRVNCNSGQNERIEGSSKFTKRLRLWLEQAKQEQVPAGERVVRAVATASAAPMVQYIADPFTFLHSLDPRVKQAWLLALVILPAWAHLSIRLGLVGLLVLLTVVNFPYRMWKDQLRGMVVLSLFLFVVVALGTDGAPSLVQPRTPPPAMEAIPDVPRALHGYSYVVMKLGPLQLTRKGLTLATTASSLSFSIIQSATLCLMTTTPEQLAAALCWYLAPLKHLRITVDETILTLLLSLRFTGLVFDEVRNIALAVVARGVHWKSLKLLETVDVFLTLFGRLFKNLLNHSVHIAQAMVARGFKGRAEGHRIYFLNKLSIKIQDKMALLGLLLLVLLTCLTEVFQT